MASTMTSCDVDHVPKSIYQPALPTLLCRGVKVSRRERAQQSYTYEYRTRAGDHVVYAGMARVQDSLNVACSCSLLKKRFTGDALTTWLVSSLEYFLYERTPLVLNIHKIKTTKQRDIRSQTQACFARKTGSILRE